jgi:hypothetical protein
METINLIRNCMVRFRRVCPQTWEQLSSTSARAMRFCATCNREVFLCETDAEALEHAQAGHCIAKPMPDHSDPLNAGATLTLGVPEAPEVPPPQPTHEEHLLMQEHSREIAKTNERVAASRTRARSILQVAQGAGRGRAARSGC